MNYLVAYYNQPDEFYRRSHAEALRLAYQAEDDEVEAE
jgi:hypothetical protein